MTPFELEEEEKEERASDTAALAHTDSRRTEGRNEVRWARVNGLS